MLQRRWDRIPCLSPSCRVDIHRRLPIQNHKPPFYSPIMAGQRIIQPHENRLIAESRVERKYDCSGGDIGPKQATTTSLGSRCHALSFTIITSIAPSGE
ncbi:hypothetical protein B0I37DRAFT_174790 [Chaetomium sp. MPI-CAGE-AT-0009]|nr:hypothetical protein B0I37DRAFT_174790 [Chaetomium sp. MPI-CAGE-AT-0009]